MKPLIDSWNAYKQTQKEATAGCRVKIISRSAFNWLNRFYKHGENRNPLILAALGAFNPER
jgi:hypothetical protein